MTLESLSWNGSRTYDQGHGETGDGRDAVDDALAGAREGGCDVHDVQRGWKLEAVGRVTCVAAGANDDDLLILSLSILLNVMRAMQ